MKTQKVEIELPAFEDWEFVRLGDLTESESKSDAIGVLLCTDTNEPHILPASVFVKFSHCFIYKRKKPRKIIFKEVGFYFPGSGDYFVDNAGGICKFDVPDHYPKMIEKRPILKKIHDDFEANND